MKKLTRSSRRIIGAAIITTALFLMLLLAPLFIKTAPIENKLRSLVAKHTGNAVTFQHVELSLLLRPRLIVHTVGISFPGTVTGTLESVHVYPELLPLLLGRVRIAKVGLDRPDLALELSEHREKKRKKKGAVPPEQLQEKIASVIASIRSLAPQLVASMDEGRLAVAIDGEPALLVSDLQVRLALPPNGLDIAITG